MRETRSTYGGAQFGYLWAFVNPMAGVAILATLFSFLISNPPIGTNTPLFLGTGFLLYTFYARLSSSMMHAISANRPMLNYPLVNTTDVIAARFLLIFLTETIVILLFFGGLTLLAEDVSFPARVESVILSIFIIGCLGLGAGMVNMVLLGLWRTWSQVEGLLTRPLFFISGIFFLPTRFDANVQYWLSWNPILHGIEWIRIGYYPTYESTILDKQYLIIFALTLLFLGLVGERLYRKRLLATT